MIDIQTYRARIGSAPAMMSKILQRKVVRLKIFKNKTHHDYEDSLRKFLKNLPPEIHYLLLILFVFVLPVRNSSAQIQTIFTSIVDHIQNEFITQLLHDTFQITRFCECSETVFETVFTVVCAIVFFDSIGAVHFIGILLLIAGIEPNPGPKPNDKESKARVSLPPENLHEPIGRALPSEGGSASSSLNNSGFARRPFASSDCDTLSNVSDLPFDKMSTSRLASRNESSNGDGTEEMRKSDLNFARTDFGAQYMEALLRSLDNRDPSNEIRVLDLSESTYCGQPWGKHTEGLNFLVRLIRHPRLQTVTYVNLSRCRLEVAPESLDTMDQCLKTLNINSNKFSKLEHPVTACQTLEELTLSDNHISGEFIITLLRFLEIK